jgi:hypothetical protein
MTHAGVNRHAGDIFLANHGRDDYNRAAGVFRDSGASGRLIPRANASF